MDAKNITTLLTKLGLKRVRAGRGWVTAECPFTSRHSGGRDKHPSFNVNIAPHRSSKYNCKGGSCRAWGDNLLSLIWRLAATQGRVDQDRFARITEWVIKNDNSLAEANYRKEQEKDAKKNTTSASVSSYKWAVPAVVPGLAPAPEGKALHLVFQPPEPTVLPEDHLAPMRDLPPNALAYLQGAKRRLRLETVAAWELGYRGGRIVIPIRDFKQRLVGISGRLVNENGYGPKFLHSLGFRRDFFLFGESKVVAGGTGYVVEGFFDVIGLWQSGYRNAVAIMGSYPSKHQVEKVAQFFSNVVIVPDGDAAGHEMALQVMEAVKPYLPARIVEMPLGKDPDDLTSDELLDRLGPPVFDNRPAV
jgi:hypothetical protein